MITVSGLGSGLDIEGLVSQLVAAERQGPENRIAQKEAVAQAELSAFGQLRGALSGLQSAAAKLDDPSTYNRMNATSGDWGAISLTADSTAAEASYEVEVSQLATRQSLASDTFADRDSTAVGNGTLTIRFGTTDYDADTDTYNGFSLNPQQDILSLEIDSSNNTLQGIANAINEAEASVSAAVVNAGDGYRLLLSSTSTGAENSLEISVTDDDGNDSDAAGLSRLAFNSSATHMAQTEAALDAALTINGLDVSSASNELSDLVDGVSLSLKEVTESPVTLGITRDTASITSSVQGMVDAYNSLRGTISRLAGFNADTQVGGLLQGDFTVGAIDNRLRSMLRTEVEGLQTGLTSLAEVGISTQADGTLNLDTGTLNDAMEDDLDAVVALFSSAAVPSDDSISVLDFGDDTSVGNYAVVISQAASASALQGAGVLPDFAGGGSIVIDDDNDSFTIAVDGSESAVITLSQATYTDGNALAAEIQARINSASAIQDAGASATVTYNSTDNRLVITSDAYGADSLVELLSVDTNSAAELGLSVASGPAGTDVAGTIGGVAATGTGRVLKAGEDSPAGGLSLEVSGSGTGPLGSINFSRGLFHGLQNLLDEFLEDDGALDSRTDGLQDRLDRLEDDRTALDARIETVEERYRTQFVNLDLLLMQLNSTSQYLADQLANLPGPRKSDSN